MYWKITLKNGGSYYIPYTFGETAEEVAIDAQAAFVDVIESVVLCGTVTK